MSTAYLVLLFLCFSLHACSAWHLNPLDKKLVKKQHLSIKNDVQNGLHSTQKVNEGNDKRKIGLDANSEKPKSRKSTNNRVLKAVGIKASMASKRESYVSVSWHVPHKKHSQKHPGFNLDYSPPKTHPPSHN